MKTMKQLLTTSAVLVATMAFSTGAIAAEMEMDHSKMNMGSKKSSGMKCGGGMDMGKKKKSSMSMGKMKEGMKCGGMSGSKMNYKKAATASANMKLKRLSALPASGKGREAGFDGKYAMEATSSKDTLATQCAKATRGIVMVDNATWARCGGKPKGWSSGPGNAKKMDHSKHQM